MCFRNALSFKILRATGTLTSRFPTALKDLLVSRVPEVHVPARCINKEEKIPIVEPEEESEDQLELNKEPSLPEVSEDKEDIPTKPSTSKYNLRPRSSLQTPSRYEDFYLKRDGRTESALLTYSEAISGPNQEKWEKAIKEEK
ncbi:hypothetical protein LAZ67_13003052 [Cordylochernes scorpioides]|uniref:Uncharacterized protein n=1 Tax=Cordylochernes scorpioides TaxID=51811 RepID=A0ABY6L9T4_9ARAC|nr:hypothetical protein LAZ67_13003052 [Cordylochernes scorpioides]